MRSTWPAVLLLLCAACDGGPSEPTPAPGPTSAGEGFAQVAPLLDWARPELSEASAALARSDSAEASRALLAALAAADALEPPHQHFADPVPLADALMSGMLSLPPHPSTTLPDDPTWDEDPFGDSNWLFQYHSFRWSLPLLQAWQETGNEAYLDRLLFLMQDYADDKLASTGPLDMTWYDMSASLRTEHWLAVWLALIDGGRMEPQLMHRFLIWFWLHGDRLAHDVHYHWYNNHGTLHNRALLVLSFILPQFLDGEEWRDLALGRTEDQILQLLSADGVENEQAPAYHFFMMEVIGSVQSILESAGTTLGSEALTRLQGMPGFGAQILTPGLTLPMLGDTPRSIALGAYAGLSDELDFALSSGDAGVAPTRRYTLYPETGTSIFRSGWGVDRSYALETHAVFDVGPRGGWHGHDDALTFCLGAYGRPLVTDSGFYTYNDDAWRAFFTSPAAHNVLVHADGDEAGRSETPQRLFWRTGADWAWQAALLDLGDGRSWIRHFVHLAPDDVLLVDRCSGPGGRPLTLLFHFPPTATLSGDAAMLRLSDGAATLDLASLDTTDLTLLRGVEDPPQGWISPAYGQREANDVAVYSAGRGSAFTTLLHAGDGSDALLAFEREAEGPDDYLRLRIDRESGPETLELWLESGQLSRSRS
ncbi:MAG: alginate lyase family protein [Candidatus Latescibacteria bacterium]|nr:alginate lyase family protein [Candidatus Latescibacterota bacterium]